VQFSAAAVAAKRITSRHCVSGSASSCALLALPASSRADDKPAVNVSPAPMVSATTTRGAATVTGARSRRYSTAPLAPSVITTARGPACSQPAAA